MLGVSNVAATNQGLLSDYTYSPKQKVFKVEASGCVLFQQIKTPNSEATPTLFIRQSTSSQKSLKIQSLGCLISYRQHLQISYLVFHLSPDGSCHGDITAFLYCRAVNRILFL